MNKLPEKLTQLRKYNGFPLRVKKKNRFTKKSRSRESRGFGSGLYGLGKWGSDS